MAIRLMVSHEIKSPESNEYNCIAWAAEEDIRWWWPDPSGIYYWPHNVPRKETVEAFVGVYKTLGYEICDNENLETGFQKVAIYIRSDGTPTHAARQLNNGNWTSKLGRSFDIEHPFIREWIDTPKLRLSDYGKLGVLLKKPIHS